MSESYGLMNEKTAASVKVMDTCAKLSQCVSMPMLSGVMTVESEQAIWSAYAELVASMAVLQESGMIGRVIKPSRINMHSSLDSVTTDIVSAVRRKM